MAQEKNKPEKRAAKWLVFIGMPFQMGITIYVFYWAGTWLDEHFQVEAAWWSKGLAMLGIIVSLSQFIRQAKRMNQE